MDHTVPETTPTTVPARDLTVGQHIRWAGVIAEVRHLLPYRDPDRVERIAITGLRLDNGRPLPLTTPADEKVTLATDEQVAEAGAAQRREELADKLRAAADQLHRLANDVVRRRLPVPSYPVGIEVHGIVDSRADLEAWAAHLGVSVPAPVSATDRIPSCGAECGPLAIRMQSAPEPQPWEVLPPAEWARRDGVTVLDADGWAGADWDRPIWREEWERRVAASTVERLTHRPAPAEAGEQS